MGTQKYGDAGMWGHGDVGTQGKQQGQHSRSVQSCLTAGAAELFFAGNPPKFFLPARWPDALMARSGPASLLAPL